MIQPTGKNSWHICKPTEECHTLFDGQTLGFFAHFFYCSCGKEEAYVSNMQTTTYQCSECDNKDFLEKSILRESILYNVVDISYEYMEVDGGLKGIAYIDVPTDTNFLRKKILFERKILAELDIQHNGNQVLSPKSFNNKDLIKKLHKKLKMYALDTYSGMEPLKLINENTLDGNDRLLLILFFLKYPKLKNVEFYFWRRNRCLPKLFNPQNELSTEDALNYLMYGRKERSIRKAVFYRHNIPEMEVKKMQGQMLFDLESLDRFSPDSIFIICRCFDDPNIASMLIRKEAFFHPSDTTIKMKDTIWLIMFLKKYYSEANIAQLLLSVGKHRLLWKDVVRMAANDKRAIRREFKKVKLSIPRLHDTFMRIEIKRGLALKFTYTNVQKKACIKQGNLEFKLPYTGNELNKWGEDLENCMFSYHPSIAKKDTVIYGVFKNKQLLYAVEIVNGSVNQASGKYNQEVLAEDNRVIELWFRITLGMETMRETAS